MFKSADDIFGKLFSSLPRLLQRHLDLRVGKGYQISIKKRL